jgi:hypothetical protein
VSRQKPWIGFTVPDNFSGFAIELLDNGDVTGRWFIPRQHNIARRLLKDLRPGVERVPRRRLRMAKAGP